MKRLFKGFTLIELTVSMGVLALIIGLTAGVLISVVNAYQKQKVISEIERNGDFVMRSIEESLRGAISIQCLDYSGAIIIPDGTGVVSCELGNNRLLFVNHGAISTKYYGRGMNNTATCDGSHSCYIYSFSNLAAFNGGANFSATSITTNNSVTGAHISSFTAQIRGDGTSSQPYNILVTMDVKGPIGSIWADESRTFQSFLTLRGTYK